jgi:transposase
MPADNLKLTEDSRKMPCLATLPARVLGCDVGKTTIVVFDAASGRTATIDNHPDALARFATALEASCFVVCEATGGYENALLAALVAAGVSAHRADARKVKAFIRSFGTLAKTDRIDARALARYAKDRFAELPLWQAPQVERDRLKKLVLLRRDLVTSRLAWANRRDAPGQEAVQPRLQALLAAFDEQIRALEADIETLVEACQPMARAVKTLIAIQGVGHTTAAALLALMPELGSLPRRKAAALAGLAPHPAQSGLRDAYRRTKGGRPEIKRVLFMAALSARKHNPALSACYQRLIANGKKPIVAITAIMRKLVVLANAILKNMKPATL